MGRRKGSSTKRKAMEDAREHDRFRAMDSPEVEAEENSMERVQSHQEF